MSAVQPEDQRVTAAVAVLIDAIRREIPSAALRPLPPYDDEDYTLEVQIPVTLERETAMDICLRHALAVEAQWGVLILTRVRPAARETTV